MLVTFYYIQTRTHTYIHTHTHIHTHTRTHIRRMSYACIYNISSSELYILIKNIK